MSLAFRRIHAVRDGLDSHGSCLHLIWKWWESSSWDGNSTVPHFSSQIQEKTHFGLFLETTSHFQRGKINQFFWSLAELGRTGFNWDLLEGAHPARLRTTLSSREVAGGAGREGKVPQLWSWDAKGLPKTWSLRLKEHGQVQAVTESLNHRIS